MDIVLHSLIRNHETYGYNLSISIGGGPSKIYKATYEQTGTESGKFRPEPELLKQLIELSQQRYDNPVKYSVELMQIVGAFSRGKPIPNLPATLGTTSFFWPVLNKSPDAHAV
jgi:hypothetical protein